MHHIEKLLTNQLPGSSIQTILKNAPDLAAARELLEKMVPRDRKNCLEQ